MNPLLLLLEDPPAPTSLRFGRAYGSLASAFGRLEKPRG